MALLTLSDLSIGFNGPSLLDQVNCTLNAGERVGLLGRNGAGKTTLMRLIAGLEQPDAGSVLLQPGRRLAMLQQDVPAGRQEKIADVVAAGVTPEPHEAEWKTQNRVEQILSRMSLDGDVVFDHLSSGMKRRVLLAKALVCDPDLLLLDEPTNHLDVEAIDWLESFLLKFGKAIVFVTHDRMFLRRMATRILEIDRGQLFDWTCDYETFLKRKEDAIAAQEKQDALFDKRLAEEEAWIRKGIKARRTRNEGRVRALKKMRSERAQRREKIGTSQLQIHQERRSGDQVLVADNVSFAYQDGPSVLNDFSTTILRGDKVGIIGPNGQGKSTLLKLLLGKLQPDSGSVKLGTHLDIAYFDQLREQLDVDQTVAENVGEGYEHIQIGGVKKHLYGYLQEFLFSPQRARTQIKFLSGGERNRILLAKLFTKPANLIVLDEPTNDLDAETLEMLEARIVEFKGTVLLVSHDREFLNNVVSSTLVFENGEVNEYVGGYDDWIRQRPTAPATNEQNSRKPDRVNSSKPKSSPSDVAATPRKLSYKEKRELELLPEAIEQLEAKISALHEEMANPDFYKQGSEAIAAKQGELQELDSELTHSYERWEELESRT